MAGYSLRDVAEGRVAVSKILDLLLVKAVEAMITFAQVTLFVLPFAVYNTSNRQDQHAHLTREVDRMSGMVFRRILGNIGPEKVSDDFGAKGHRTM